jgi:hypothetical protein
VERALRVVDGFQHGSEARRGRHVSDEVPASVAVGPVQPPSHSAMPQSREGRIVHCGPNGVSWASEGTRRSTGVML